MSKKGIRLTEKELKNALVGGTILGGGGGGSAKKGEQYAKIAVAYNDLRLVDINDIPEDELLLTASLVGAPAAVNQFLYPADFARTIELLQKNSDVKIGGIITNENGGEATVNGWLQASMMGLPLVDAPCNGRAHPTGVMGSMNLHKQKDYVTMQACVGGNPETNSHVECFFTGSIEHTSKLVRMASVEAGGLVAVARNPVTAAYAKENAAVGGVSHAIRTGEVFNKGLETSVEQAVNDVCAFLEGKVIAKGAIEEYELKYEGGFDVGYVKVDGLELTFWNEYATADKDGQRISTFPNLIMTIDANTGVPVTTAMLKKGMEVYVITTDKKNLCLSPTMYEPELLQTVEDIVKKEIVKYLEVTI